TFVAIEARLSGAGYAGRLAMKGRRRPDGCATFFRIDRCSLLSERRVLYRDGVDKPNSGNVAQVMTFDVGGMGLDLINTHLKWDPPGTAKEAQWGYRQALQALGEFPEPSVDRLQLMCGDFNATPDSEVITLLTEAGFQYTHHAAPGVFTCNSNREP